MKYATQQNTLLWLDDMKKTVEEQIVFAKEHLYVKCVSQLQTFAKVLNDPSYQVKGIVLDVMLRGIDNLDSLQIADVGTDYGYQAGWRILEYYLRASNSEFKKIPVLVLSVRDLSEENKELIARLRNQEETALITLIGKNETVEKIGDKEWDEKFKDWINNLSSGNLS